MLLDNYVLNKPLPVSEDQKKLERVMEFCEASFEVDEEYWDELEPSGSKILAKFPCEEAHDYQFRKSAIPRNYVAPLVEKYISSVYMYPPEIDLNSEFQVNINLLGTDINSFMKEQLTTAMVNGSSYFLVDSTSSMEGVLTEAQANEIGNRLYVSEIDPEDVYDCVEILSFLAEILIWVDDYTLRYYNATETCDIIIDKSNYIRKITPLVAHGYAQVPVVKISPQETDAPITMPWARLQMDVNRTLSLVNLEKNSNVFTRVFITGVKEADLPFKEDRSALKSLLSSPTRAIVLENADATVQTIGDVSFHAELLKDMDNSLQALFAAAHIPQTEINGGTAPSGYSLKIMKEDFINLCRKLAKSLEKAERDLARLVPEFTPRTYSSEYIAANLAEDTETLRNLLSLDIPQEYKDKAIEGYGKKYGFI